MSLPIITLQNLYDFCEKNNLSHYSSTENDGQMIFVKVPAKFGRSKVSKFAKESPEGLMPVILQSCHVNLNRNGSYISKETMEKALPTFKNKPILGHIIQKEDGTYDFDSHDMEVIDDPWNEGEKRVKYIETPIGVVPESCNARLEYDKSKKKTYVVVDGWIFEDYGNGAAEIIQEKGGTKVSVELGVKELSYNSKEKYLEIEDFVFMGVTALGDHVGEGMEGSNMQISDLYSYAADENPLNIEETLAKMNEILKKIDNHFVKEEGGNRKLKLDELLKQYNITIDDVTFDIEGLTDEELVSTFKEHFDADDTTGESEPEPAEPVDDTGETNPDVTEPEPEVELEDLESGDEPLVDDDKVKKRTHSVNIGEKNYTFETSLDEVIYALELLINNTYAESDNAYYGVKAYDKYVVMVDCWTGKAFKQNYKVRSGSYSLVGDRVEVYSRYLTKEEEQALDDMRSKYSVMEEKLNAYVEKEESDLKDALLKSDEYELINEQEEFAELQKNVKDYSLDELRKECDDLLLKYAKSAHTFAANVNKKSFKRTVKINAEKEAEYKPYGSLFDSMSR